MAKTLAELRAEASGPTPRPKATRTVTLIEGQHLLDRTRVLTDELTDVLAQAERAEANQPDEEDRERIRKAGAPAEPKPEPPTRALEIIEERASLVDELTEHQVDIGLIGIAGGDWHRFKEANPARQDNQVDAKLAKGHCNADALFAAIGQFIATWNGEQVAERDWDDVLAERICYADRRDLIPAIVEMYEGKIDRAPKSRSSSPETPSSGTD